MQRLFIPSGHCWKPSRIYSGLDCLEQAWTPSRTIYSHLCQRTTTSFTNHQCY